MAVRQLIQNFVWRVPITLGISSVLCCAQAGRGQKVIVPHVPSADAGRQLIAAEGDVIDIVLRRINPNAPPGGAAIRYDSRLSGPMLDLHAADPEFVSKLVNAIDDTERDPWDRQNLILAIGVLGPKAAEASSRLVEIASSAKPMALDTDDTASVRRRLPTGDVNSLGEGAAVQTLRAIGAPAVPAIVEAIKTGPPRNVPLFVAILRDIGAEAEEAAPVLRERLRLEQDPRQVVELLNAIKSIDPSELDSPHARMALPKVMEAIDLADDYYAPLAASMLQDLQVPAEGAVPRIVQVAAANLRKAQERNERVGLGALVFFQSISGYGEDAAAPLSKLAGSDDVYVRQAAAYLLASPGVARQRHVELLAKLLRQDRSPEVRAAAASALGALGNKARSVEDQLQQAAETDPDPSVRDKADQALAKLAGKM